MKISNQPPKGTSDWLPEQFKVRKYIFDTWREVCVRFGYQEYLTPLVELAELYRAKSGEDLGGKELMTMIDRAGRELAIRPEMTPSVTRLISRIYEGTPKPIRYFSIANFMRNEKPQRGRNREFWQLNYDIFGAESVVADIEIMQIAIEIMLQLGAPKGSFEVYINNRRLIDGILNEIGIDDQQKTDVVRVLDKWEKLTVDDFNSKLAQLGVTENQSELLTKYMQSENEEDLLSQFPNIKENQGFKEVKETILELKQLGYSEWIRFKPNIIRGFDYYDGLVFEVFDKNQENNRSMFGGGRYNGLAELFGSQSFPAVGSAPGDETTKLFLESWGLTEKILTDKKENFYLPILDQDLKTKSLRLAQKLRSEEKIVEISLEISSLNKALKVADKKGFSNIVILGTSEAEKSIYKVKDLKSGKEESFSYI